MRVSTSELKILIVFIYFIAFSVTALTAITIASQSITELVSELAIYFACESQGLQPGRICERNFINKNIIGAEVTLLLTKLFLGFFPVVSLVYVINYQEIKEKYLKWCADRSGVSDVVPGITIANSNV